ncbi:MAG: A/G-specific adenine glycosylase [Candidatus Eisenbacteria bacterium]|nr:A/G-specific adenine glycosylase [Candidatus Eisenbacteria bacterium]
MLAPTDDSIRPAPFRRALLTWYRRVGRDLPWRRNRTAWRIWVSEMMLQQTTVATVLPRYESFLRDFPTIARMAGAPLEAVLASWSGLGYYRRARNLHAAASIVMTTHGGRFPRDREAVRALPGFGDYSTAAILSIVHGQPMAVVDGNVIRVISRLRALPGHSRSPILKRAVQAEADQLISPEEPGDFNQAIMELGATVCTPTSPRCDDCPVTPHCRAHRLGVVAAHPAAPPKQKTQDERWQVAVIESNGRVLMRRRPESARLMPGLWELPAWELGDESELASLLGREIAPGIKFVGTTGRARHAIMNRRLELIVHRAELRQARAPLGWSWVNRGEVVKLPVSSMVTKALTAAHGKTTDRQARLLLGAALILGIIGHGVANGGTAGLEIPPPIVAADSIDAPPSPGPLATTLICVPPLEARTVTGESVSLHRLIAKGPVLINFWALWCKPCLKELPEMQKLQEQFGARGLTILSINGDSPTDVARVAPFVRARKLTFPVLTDLDGSLRRRFQANAFPTSMLLDSSGRVTWTSQGYRPGDSVAMAEQVEALLSGTGESGE